MPGIRNSDLQFFSGRKRKKSTRKGVALSDTISHIVITFGGIGTIVVVLGVCLFLISVVIPLFKSAQISKPAISKHAWLKKHKVVYASIDDYQALAVMISEDCSVYVFRPDTGEILRQYQLFKTNKISSVSHRVGNKEVVFGLQDGTVAMLKLEYVTSFVKPSDLTKDERKKITAVKQGIPVTYKKSVIQVTPEGQFRLQGFKYTIVMSVKTGTDPVSVVEYVMRPSGPVVCYALKHSNASRIFRISGSEEDDFLTGERKYVFDNPVKLNCAKIKTSPAFLAISGSGKDVYAAWDNGKLIRLRVDNETGSYLAESGYLTEAGDKLTAMMFMLGDTTLVWADSSGKVKAGFPVRIQNFSENGLAKGWQNRRSQYRFTISKNITQEKQSVISLASSARTRTLFCGLADGSIKVFFTTSATKMASIKIPESMPIDLLAVAPKEDGFLAIACDKTYHFAFAGGYPEASLQSLFAPVWYEGYAKPLQMWQSEGATEDIERKLGLIPLIFGTLKATFYAMLFAAPIALLAAIYSSEFMNSKLKGVVKPLIEMMASLPSVVLGFLAALVFAPLVEQYLPSVLLLLFTVPGALLLFAYFWQILSATSMRKLEKWKFFFCVIPVGLGVFAAILLGSPAEMFLFAGDIKGWLSWERLRSPELADKYGNSLGGWLLIFLPISITLTWIFINRKITPLLRLFAKTASPGVSASLDLLKFLTASLLSLLLAGAVGYLLDSNGFDLRTDWIFAGVDISPLDIYVQRNALIVGVVMGFAVIPIIYTIADDAMSSVPDHLRSASLGAGATRWQTTLRIVIPTAMSGLFSAIMIGLGRAVGETMIVLMALGNTAIMDFNLFNGARTMSANIAVELPEAVKGSAHYRTLFLAALVLFVMTFLLNTIAESVRLRFRKKSGNL